MVAAGSAQTFLNVTVRLPDVVSAVVAPCTKVDAAEWAIFTITNGTKPILIESGNFTAVIMPMLVECGKDPFPEDEAIAITLPEMAMA